MAAYKPKPTEIPHTEFNLKSFLNFHSIFNLVVIGIIFYIPLAWSRYLNANYVSAKFFLLFLVSSLSLVISCRKLVLPQLSKSLWILMGLAVLLHLTTLLVSQNLTDAMYLFKFFSFCFMIYYFYSLKVSDLQEIFKDG